MGMELIEPAILKTQICNLTAEYDTEAVHIDALIDLIDNQPTVKAIPLERLEQIRAEMIDKSFSVVNPNDTYEYINVIDLDSLEGIIDKAIKEQLN